MRTTAFSILVATGLVAAAPRAVAGAEAPPATVPRVDLERYAGRWFEIARFPNRFQDHCAGDVVATYARRPDGKLDVLNACRTADGGRDEATGLARVATTDGSNSKLKVRFAPAFLSWLPAVWGDYWIVALADDYSWAVVGDRERKYLWLLARTPQVDDATYERLRGEANAKGYDVSRLVRTRQAG